MAKFTVLLLENKDLQLTSSWIQTKKSINLSVKENFCYSFFLLLDQKMKDHFHFRSRRFLEIFITLFSKRFKKSRTFDGNVNHGFILLNSGVESIINTSDNGGVWGLGEKSGKKRSHKPIASRTGCK